MASSATSRYLSFRTLLPLAVIFLTAVLLADLTGLNYVTFSRAAPRTTDLSHHLLRDSLFSAATLIARPVTGLNFPGIVGEVILSMAMHTWPESYRPSAILGGSWVSLFAFRTFVFPFFCAPFWYLAGLGLDATFLRRRPHWSVLLLGTLLFAGIATIAIGMSTAVRELDEDMVCVFSGLALWTILLLTFPIAGVQRILQHRRARRLPALP